MVNRPYNERVVAASELHCLVIEKGYFSFVLREHEESLI